MYARDCFSVVVVTVLFVFELINLQTKEWLVRMVPFWCYPDHWEWSERTCANFFFRKGWETQAGASNEASPCPRIRPGSAKLFLIYDLNRIVTFAMLSNGWFCHKLSSTHILNCWLLSECVCLVRPHLNLCRHVGIRSKSHAVNSNSNSNTIYILISKNHTHIWETNGRITHTTDTELSQQAIARSDMLKDLNTQIKYDNFEICRND
jgi:hypothetical protein